MTPLFTWNPVAGAQSYYVLVAKDPNFTTVIDYALTRDPAYSPRTFTQTRGYADETTLLYWAVLPATGVNGSGSTGDPLSAAPSNFQKQTVGPGLLSPTAGQDFWGPVTFQWSPSFSAQQYRLQVSQDPTFANPIETVVTDSTEYTSNTSYPADTVLYWRVRADAENGVGNPTTVGLTWSATGTFQKHLVTPTLDGDSSTPQIDPNPTQGTTVPTFEWDPVQSADSYDFKVQIPNGTSTGSTSQTFNIPTHAFSFGTMKGTGIWKWQVRAIFPGTTAFQTVAGPWTTLQNFVRTIPEPASATQAVAGSTVNFSWDPRQARVYHVQVSTRPDFGQLVENTTTDNTDYAPLLTQYNYQGGGTFYWRVAAADDTSMNLGDYTAAHTFTIGPPTAPTALKRFRLSVVGYPIRNRLRTVTIHVKNAATGGPVGAATVSVYGAGVLPKSKLSSPTGVASFSIKATKLGTVTWRVSKTSFVTKYLYQTVRAG